MLLQIQLAIEFWYDDASNYVPAYLLNDVCLLSTFTLFLLFTLIYCRKERGDDERRIACKSYKFQYPRCLTKTNWQHYLESRPKALYGSRIL
jgi:hypothetical protein